MEQINHAEENEIKVLQELQKAGYMDIASSETSYDFEDQTRFTKLKMDNGQKMQVNALLQQMPMVMAAGTLAKTYTVTFPEGVPHVLTALKQGGFSTAVKGENGRFVGSASLYETANQAMMLNVFTAMSVATGQYFLSEINKEMKLSNLKLYKILEFLYGDKKAELMSEISFAKYAYQNYASIMAHEQQRVATLVSLQQARKVAMKDIEFYMGDLNSAVNSDTKNFADIEEMVRKSSQIKDSLDVSIQLYMMSSLMEVYFAENHDPDYIRNLDADMTAYIDKSEKRILTCFSVLQRRIGDYKGKPLEKFDKTEFEEKIGVQIDSLSNGEESEVRKMIHSSLRASSEKTQYYVNNTGDVYLKVV